MSKEVLPSPSLHPGAPLGCEGSALESQRSACPRLLRWKRTPGTALWQPAPGGRHPFTLLLGILCLLPSLLWGEERKKEELPITQPVFFSADLLEASRPEGKVVLTGNAYARHGSTEIYAHRMEILYDADGKTVKEVNAYERVRFMETGRKGRAERARYTPASRVLILEGSPTLWEGEDELHGKRIIVYRDPDRVVVEGAEARVSPERLKEYSNPTTPATAPAR